MTILHLWNFSTKLDIKSVTSFPLDLVNYTLKSPSCCLAEYLLSVIIRPLPSQSLGPNREETNCLSTYGYLMLRDCGHLLMLRDCPLLGWGLWNVPWGQRYSLLWYNLGLLHWAPTPTWLHETWVQAQLHEGPSESALDLGDGPPFSCCYVCKVSLPSACGRVARFSQDKNKTSYPDNCEFQTHNA